jgi:hypothetical protein
MLVVEAQGDPREVGAEAFGLVFQLYFQSPETPKGMQQTAPRARWPVSFEEPRSEWVGLYALPVPESMATLPDHDAPPGLRPMLTTWEYGYTAEILHLGPYDREGPTLDRLREYVAGEGYDIVGEHEEEYIRGPTMFGPGDPEEYITILRYRVRKSVFHLLVGAWEGTGSLFGSEASFRMEWEWVLNDRFVRLTFQNRREGSDGVERVMDAQAFYKPAKTGHHEGTWFDSRGVVQPLQGENVDSVLTVLWGTAETEQGRTVYRVQGEDQLEVEDAVLKEGQWHPFGRAVYRRVEGLR